MNRILIGWNMKVWLPQHLIDCIALYSLMPCSTVLQVPHLNTLSMSRTLQGLSSRLTSLILSSSSSWLSVSLPHVLLAKGALGHDVVAEPAARSATEVVLGVMGGTEAVSIVLWSANQKSVGRYNQPIRNSYDDMISQSEVSMMIWSANQKSVRMIWSANENSVWIYDQPMRSQYDDMITQWEVSMMIWSANQKSVWWYDQIIRSQKTALFYDYPVRHQYHDMISHSEVSIM